MVLASPIILYDHPEIAPESRTAFFDALEVDELLSLRTMTLSDEEKREVRGTDPRAAALLATSTRCRTTCGSGCTGPCATSTR